MKKETIKWVTEEKSSKSSLDNISVVKHGSLQKAMRSILRRLYSLKGVKLFWVIIPGKKAFKVYVDEEQNNE